MQAPKNQSNRKTAILVIGTKHCNNFREFDYFVNWCLEVWNKDINNIVFIAEEERGADYLIRSFLTKTIKVGSFEQNYIDVHCNWEEHGKLAGLIKNKELIKLTLKHTHIKETPKILLFLDDTSHPDLIIKNDKWSIETLIKTGLKEGFELYCYHPSTAEKINEQKQFEQEISEEDNEILNSAKRLAKAMKGNVVEENVVEENENFLKMLSKNNTKQSTQEIQKENSVLDWNQYDPDEIPF